MRTPVARMSSTDFLTGLADFGRMMKNDVQFDGLELLRPADLTAQLLLREGVIATAWYEDRLAHFDPSVAAQMDEAAKVEIAPRFIFADWAGAALRRANRSID